MRYWNKSLIELGALFEWQVFIAVETSFEDTAAHHVVRIFATNGAEWKYGREGNIVYLESWDFAGNMM